MRFNFVSRVDRELFDRTKVAWLAQLEENPENTSTTYYGAGLDYCQRTVNNEVETGDSPGCLCAVVEDGRESAVALLVISHARARSESAYLKMLDIYVQPTLNLADTEPNYSELAWVAATAIVGCLELTYEDFPSQQLKVYTTLPLDKEFMSAIATAVFGQGEMADHYDLKSHGNWLVLTKKAGSSGSHVRLVG